MVIRYNVKSLIINDILPRTFLRLPENLVAHRASDSLSCIKDMFFISKMRINALLLVEGMLFIVVMFSVDFANVVLGFSQDVKCLFNEYRTCVLSTMLT